MLGIKWLRDVTEVWQSSATALLATISLPNIWNLVLDITEVHNLCHKSVATAGILSCAVEHDPGGGMVSLIDVAL